jgi:glycosyltransferase involved in cell wall biosynthesis
MRKSIFGKEYRLHDLLVMKIKNIFRKSVSVIVTSSYRCHTKKIECSNHDTFIDSKFACIIIYANGIVENDGVSNDVLFEAATLRSRGVSVYVGAAHCSEHERLNILTTSETINVLEHNKCWLIYHHSIYCEDADIVIKASRGRCIVRYHNVTPPEFYKYCAAIAHTCKMGLLQIERIIRCKRIAGYLATSNFNKKDLVCRGASAQVVRICPPYIPISEPVLQKTEVNQKIFDIFSKWEVNIIFVGRLVSNKGYIHLVKVLEEFKKHYKESICLHLVGNSYNYMISYYSYLDNMILKAGVAKNIFWWGPMSNKCLDQIYKLSTAFLCASEHEGFCIPIIEAQQRELPVLAFATSVISETVGVPFCLVKPFDYSKMAELLYVLATNTDQRSMVVEAGIKNSRKYAPEKVADTLFRELSFIGVKLNEV